MAPTHIRKVGALEAPVLWHYTSAQGLLGILQATSVLSTQLGCLNDFSELRYMYVPEPVVTQLVRDGVLQIVLEDWASPGPGFHLYYSSRRHVPAGLRLFVEVVRELRPLGL